jgi:hypothetical protein
MNSRKEESLAYIFDPIRKTYIDDEDQSLGNKLALSEDVEEIIKQIDDQFGPGTVFPASELSPKENPYKDFEDRNPAANGGMMRQNFDKGGIVKVLDYLKTLKAGTVVNTYALGKQFNVPPATIRGQIQRNFPQLKLQSVQESAEKAKETRREQYAQKKSDVPIIQSEVRGKGAEARTKGRNITGVTFPNKELENKYINYLEDRYSDVKGRKGPSNSQLAIEFFGEDTKANVAKVEKINQFYRKDLKLDFEKAPVNEAAIKRTEKEAVGKKYASTEDLERFKIVNQQKKDLNKFFKNNPNAINTTEFGKNIKALMETRLDKDGNIIRRTTDSKGNTLNNEYYKNLAERGQIFDIFDINKISKGQRSTKFATNLNIMPSQFNSAFIEGQVNKFFKEGGKFYGDTEKLNKVSDHLKSLGVRVDIENVGRIGADMGVAYDSKTGQFPHIYKTLKKMNIPDSLLTKINPTPEVEGTTLKEKIQSGASTIKSKMDASRMLTSKIPGGAIALTPLDFTMSMLSGVPLTDAAASAGSYLLKDPALGRAVNIPLALRSISDYDSAEEMIQRATERREKGEEFLQGLLEKIKEGAGDQPEISPFQAADGGRVGFDGGGAVGADDDFAKELEYYFTNPDSKLPEMQTFKETMNPITYLNDMIDPRNYPYYADILARSGVRVAEFGARILPALGQLASDLIQKPAFKVVDADSDYVQDYNLPGGNLFVDEFDMMDTGQKKTLQGTGIFSKFLENITPTSMEKKLGLDKLIETEKQKMIDRGSTAAPVALGETVGLGVELAAPIFPGVKFFQSYAKARNLPADDVTKQIMEKEIDEVLSAKGTDRREFLKVSGAGGAVILAKMLGFGDDFGRVAKVAEKAVVKTPPTVGKPEWFDALVNKVILEGDNITKQLSTVEREIVHSKKLNENETVTVYQDLNDGNIRVEYDSPTNMGQGTVVMEYKPGVADETTGGAKPRDTFETVEPEPQYSGDTDIEMLGESGGPGIEFLESDVSNLKEFATGTKLSKEELEKRAKRVNLTTKVTEDNYEAAEFLGGKYGDGPEPPDDWNPGDY